VSVSFVRTSTPPPQPPPPPPTEPGCIKPPGGVCP
jgi:hypothetical protein